MERILRPVDGGELNCIRDRRVIEKIRHEAEEWLNYDHVHGRCWHTVSRSDVCARKYYPGDRDYFCTELQCKWRHTVSPQSTSDAVHMKTTLVLSSAVSVSISIATKLLHHPRLDHCNSCSLPRYSWSWQLQSIINECCNYVMYGNVSIFLYSYSTMALKSLIDSKPMLAFSRLSYVKAELYEFSLISATLPSPLNLCNVL